METLLQRVSDALLAEYRREAIAQLKDLLQDNPKVCLSCTQIIPTDVVAYAGMDQSHQALTKIAMQ